MYLWNVRGRVAIVDCPAYVLAGFVYFSVYWVCAKVKKKMLHRLKSRNKTACKVSECDITEAVYVNCDDKLF